MTRRTALDEAGPSTALIVRASAAVAALGPSPRTLLSALLIAGSFPPWDLDFLAWIALIPWMRCISESETSARALLQGFFDSFVHQSVTNTQHPIKGCSPLQAAVESHVLVSLLDGRITKPGFWSMEGQRVLGSGGPPAI